MRRLRLKPMRDRNQVSVAIWGTVLAVAGVLVAVNLDRIPGVNPTHSYYADFANADGLKSGDDVRVEGISVGSVNSVAVQRDHVHVGFSVQSDLALGAASRASIEVATVLGNVFMQVESHGPGPLAENDTIPVSRTVVPYSLLGALESFGQFSKKTDLPTLRKSLSTLATTISGIAPNDVKAALNGLSSLSTTLAGKQREISSILTAADSIVKTLNQNSGALVSLLVQGDEFLRLIQQRHDAISQLLRDTARLGKSLTQLMQRNSKQLTTLLANLDAVTGVLAKEKAHLQAAIVNLGQFSINFTNVGGSGPWLDLLTPTTVVPDNQIVGCGKNPAAQKKPCNP
jgi:phospholipid/cholesterol/gamma-HCH transport system substrate-binding protein